MIAIIVIIAAWCMILRRCKMNGGENAIPTAPQPSGALPPPLTVPQPTAPSMPTNPAPPTAFVQDARAPASPPPPASAAAAAEGDAALIGNPHSRNAAGISQPFPCRMIIGLI